MSELAIDFSNLSDFDALAQSVTAKLRCDLSLISIAQEDALWALGHSEPDQTPETRTLLARDTVCEHTMKARAPLRVADVRSDPRLRTLSAVSAMNIGAYLGVPLRVNGDNIIGAMCALNETPRIWSDTELAYLEAVADLVESKIEKHMLRYEQKALSTALAENDAILSTLAEASGKAITVHNDAGELVFANDALREELDLTYQELLVLPQAAQQLADGGARSGDVSLDVPGRPNHALHVDLYAPKAGLTLAEWRRNDPH
ncbi:MAG: GAF domain-containing protein [Pseudomonadota bacterium]